MSEEAIADIRRLLDGLDSRVAQLEERFSHGFMAVLKGLKGADDGSTDGLYESVRKLRAEQVLLHGKLEAMVATVSQHERDKHEVIGGGRAAYLLVMLGSGLIAWLTTHFAK